MNWKSSRTELKAPVLPQWFILGDKTPVRRWETPVTGRFAENFENP